MSKTEIEQAVSRRLVEGFVRDAAEEPMEEVAQSYIQYIQRGNTFAPAGEVRLREALPRFAYQVKSTMSGISFQLVKPKTDELLSFKDSPMHRVVEEVDRFWNLKPNFDKLGLMHNRGILVYGPPGTGKSCMVQQVVETMVKRGDVVFFCSDIGALTEALRQFKEIEPRRKVTVILEDLDECMQYEERSLLHLLDGEKAVEGVCYVATTNYVDRLPPRVLRPGRFDKKVFVGPPTLEMRKTYLANKLKTVLEGEEVDSLARRTEGLSFGHLRELVIGAYAFGEPVKEVIERLRAVEGDELPDRQGRLAVKEGKVLFIRIEVPSDEDMVKQEEWERKQLSEPAPKRAATLAEHLEGLNSARRMRVGTPPEGRRLTRQEVLEIRRDQTEKMKAQAGDMCLTPERMEKGKKRKMKRRVKGKSYPEIEAAVDKIVGE